MYDGYGIVYTGSTAFNGYGFEVQINARSYLTYNIERLTSSWRTNCDAAYLMLVSKKNTIADSIPLFYSTDQHGSGVLQHRYVHNIDTLLNMANINMGDTVVGYYNTNLLTEQLTRITGVANYIGVVGNHDHWYQEGYSDIAVSKDEIRRYFPTSYTKYSQDLDSNSYAIIDTINNVKYIVFDNYQSQTGTDYLHYPTLTTIQWLIALLNKNDGYDIIFLQHWNLLNKAINRDGTILDNIASGYDHPQIRQMLIDYNKKQSRTSLFTSGTISYDFSNTSKHILCALNGHKHAEIWDVSDGLTVYCANRTNTIQQCQFVLIDRTNNKMYIYKFDTNEVYELLLIDMEVSA